MLAPQSPVAYISGFDETKGIAVDIPLFKNKVLKIGRESLKSDHQDHGDRCSIYILRNPHVSTTHCYIWTVQFDDNTPCVTYIKCLASNPILVNQVALDRNSVTVLNEGAKLYIKKGLNAILHFTNIANVEKTKGQLEVEKSWTVLPHVIGVGTFGTVQVAKHAMKPHKLFAVKTIPCDITSKFKGESTILLKLNHPNIIKIYQERVCLKPKGIRIYQDLAIGGDLFSYMSQNNSILKALSESEALFITFQILKALNYLHLNGVVHRDLKLDNILIMDVPIKFPFIVLADFGIAKQTYPLSNSQIINGSQQFLQRRQGTRSQTMYTLKNVTTRMHTIVGTAEYAAPEINLLDGDSTTVSYNEKVDVWSLGVIVHILLSGISPFYSDNLKTTVLKSRNGKLYLDMNEWKTVSNEAKDFVNYCLDLNSGRRWSIVNCMKSPWLTKDNRQYWLDRCYRDVRKRVGV